MATTFAIVAVFLPIAFMSGIIGQFFLQFGITVAVAVLVSLFVSFTLDPMLSSVWPDPKEGRFKYLPWLGRVMEKVELGVDAAHRVYDRMLRWVLGGRRYGVPGLAQLARKNNPTRELPRWASASPRILMVLLALFTFFGSFFLVPLIGTEFVPQGDQGMAFMRINTPIGSSLQYTDAKLRDVEADFAKIPGIESVVTTVGTDEGRNYAQVMLRLQDLKDHKRPSQQEIENMIREHISRMAGMHRADVVARVAAAVPPGVVDGVDARVGPERVAVGCLGVLPGHIDEPGQPPDLGPAHVGVQVDRAVLVAVVKPEQLAVVEPVFLPGGRRVSQLTLRLCLHQVLPPLRALPGGFR